MLKKTLKGIGLFVFFCAVAAVSWLASYFFTIRANEQGLYKAAENQSTSEEVFAQSKESPREKSISFEYYIVRLDGETLKVYTCADNAEEFLYSEDIVTSNLTETDLEMLRRGTVLYTTAELTEFMENFVS